MINVNFIKKTHSYTKHLQTIDLTIKVLYKYFANLNSMSFDKYIWA